MRDGLWHDTHTHPVTGAVLDVLAELARRTDPHGVPLERDGGHPRDDELAAVRRTVRPAMPAEPRGAGPGAAREEPARRQADLPATLVAGGPAPEGFDPDRLRAQASALLDKRRNVVAAHLPVLAEALGERMPRLFAGYAEERPRPAGGRATDRRGGLHGAPAHSRPAATGHRPAPLGARLPRRLRRLRPGR